MTEYVPEQAREADLSLCSRLLSDEKYPTRTNARTIEPDSINIRIDRMEKEAFGD
jgi:hypothetical protein